MKIFVFSWWEIQTLMLDHVDKEGPRVQSSHPERAITASPQLFENLIEVCETLASWRWTTTTTYLAFTHPLIKQSSRGTPQRANTTNPSIHHPMYSLDAFQSSSPTYIPSPALL